LAPEAPSQTPLWELTVIPRPRSGTTSKEREREGEGLMEEVGCRRRGERGGKWRLFHQSISTKICLGTKCSP